MLKLNPQVRDVYATVLVKPVPGQPALPYPGFKGELVAATVSSFPAEVKLPPDATVTVVGEVYGYEPFRHGVNFRGAGHRKELTIAMKPTANPPRVIYKR